MELKRCLYRPRTMKNTNACFAIGLALMALGAVACTNDSEPNATATPQATNTETRAGIDDIVVTEAALEPFIGMDGSGAYAKLRRQHFEVRFGPRITKSERNNIIGHQTHPDVVIEALELGPNEGVIITEVSCRARHQVRGRGGYC
jgi:hypothetical protein